MNIIKLSEYGSGKILYEGYYNTTVECVEAAIQSDISLNGVNLQGVNLVNAELDGGSFQRARFDRANMTGANISGADLESAILNDASLYNACFCESNLRQALFFGAAFGATDIAWSNMMGARFDTLSALDLSFSEAMSLQTALFYDRTGTVCNMSRPPVVIRGLKYPVVLFDDYMKVGSAVLPYERWQDIKYRYMDIALETDIQCFVKTYLDLLITLTETRGHAKYIKDVVNSR